eukprot:1305192-Rhodomonas_salina.1
MGSGGLGQAVQEWQERLDQLRVLLEAQQEAARLSTSHGTPSTAQRTIGANALPPVIASGVVGA